MASRLLTGLGALAAAAFLAVASPASAFAAEGHLVVNGEAYLNPAAGCYNAPNGPGELEITNSTDKAVTVFAGPDCTGGSVVTIAPGAEETAVGHSVNVA
ncbi:hypothetical protein ACIQNU_01160 [Streptomyces sp. NPDC091292]|uniref:hypothetical protein n=1 Tax=Streptomyces sp. NPDC091292 TaxID=3365991 RepID=UPI00380D60DF